MEMQELRIFKRGALQAAEVSPVPGEGDFRKGIVSLKNHYLINGQRNNRLSLRVVLREECNMSKALVVFATRYGQTRAIARHIAEMERKWIAPGSYDAVVIGSATSVK
jgi:hypothetical protein